MTSLLCLSHISAGYPGRAVLQDITLAVQPGEILAIIGPNGAGKSTLLRVMARQLAPTAGSITYSGHDAWKVGSRHAAGQVALAPTYVTPAWPLTVRDTVALGRTPHRGWWKPYTAEDKTKVETILQQNDLHSMQDRSVATLSAGETQRVTLARALAQEPKVLLLDEPTAHLDLKYQTETLQALKTLAATGIAVVVALHDVNQAARWADRVVILLEGRIMASGTPTKVLTTKSLSQAYGTPVTVILHPTHATPFVVV